MNASQNDHVREYVLTDGLRDRSVTACDLVPIRSENDKLQASGILEVLRFGTCRDHR
jgi:hypothetical protein